jgi:hypothetical protein
VGLLNLTTILTDGTKQNYKWRSVQTLRRRSSFSKCRPLSLFQHKCNFTDAPQQNYVYAASIFKKLRGTQQYRGPLQASSTEFHTNWTKPVTNTGRNSLCVATLSEALQLRIARSLCLFCKFLWTQILCALRYKPEGRGFDSRWCRWNFSLT